MSLPKLPCSPVTTRCYSLRCRCGLPCRVPRHDRRRPCSPVLQPAAASLPRDAGLGRPFPILSCHLRCSALPVGLCTSFSTTRNHDLTWCISLVVGGSSAGPEANRLCRCLWCVDDSLDGEFMIERLRPLRLVWHLQVDLNPCSVLFVNPNPWVLNCMFSLCLSLLSNNLYGIL